MNAVLSWPYNGGHRAPLEMCVIAGEMITIPCDELSQTTTTTKPQESQCVRPGARDVTVTRAVTVPGLRVLTL
jgi:hypothetical protein